MQEAAIRAWTSWPDDPPRDPKGWLTTVAWRKFLDAHRSQASRHDREVLAVLGPEPGPSTDVDDTLALYFLCTHPLLSPDAAAALTLRAVGGLTTTQIAEAYLVPESTMAQRISRAKKKLSGVALTEPGDLGTVLRVLYLVFNAGYGGDVDVAAEAIRLARQLAVLTDEPEVDGLLALMLLHHARRASRTGTDGRLIPLADQDRSRWDTALIAEGVTILQTALAREHPGQYQAQAAIAALHADAPSAAETDWLQIVEWYDELLRFADTPVVRLNRCVAVGESDGPRAALAELAALDPGLPRHAAVAAHLHEQAGDTELAGDLYAQAADAASSVPEREHLIRRGPRPSAAPLVDHQRDATGEGLRGAQCELIRSDRLGRGRFAGRPRRIEQRHTRTQDDGMHLEVQLVDLLPQGGREGAAAAQPDIESGFGFEFADPRHRIRGHHFDLRGRRWPQGRGEHQVP